MKNISKKKILFIVLMAGMMPVIANAGLYETIENIYYSKIYYWVMAFALVLTVIGILQAFGERQGVGKVLVSVGVLVLVAGNLPGGLKYVSKQTKQVIFK